ncbi:MAG TPA: tetratricopeptide repeat-containing glycosyltransferase family protein [Burkholderiaceae bacterium]|nr:tetratricopeptide repeat-containing glycosyltransferase family protein [Burkholderiaceae bacterium]
MIHDIDATLAAAQQHYVGGRLAEAASLLHGVLAVRPECAPALEGLAYVAARQGDPDRAADYILRAFETLSPSPSQYFAAANICQAARRHRHAERFFALCLRTLPDHVPARLGRALSLAELGEHSRALKMLERLTAAHPQSAELHYNKGCVLGKMGRYDGEMAAYRKALSIAPDFTVARVNLGVALRDLHRFDEALQEFGRALEIDADHAGARTNRAQTNLLLGHLESGWREYEWRWLDGGQSHNFDPATLWKGDQPIAGKTVLLHFEQGLGDTLQFVRYADLLVHAGARVVLRVQDALLPLLRDYPGVAQVIGENDAVPAFDLHCPLLTLPLAFRTGAKTIPAAVPYLKADPQRSAQWRAVIDTLPRRPRVGIAWAGSRHHPDDRNRSIPFAELAPLFATRASFVSLQKDVRESDRASITRFASLLDVSGRLETYADTAALISQLDLVISVDTSVAHLAGALGVPVWVALPFTPDWRWQLNRSDSPWYPQARLFRQSTRGNWKSVVDAMTAALTAWTPETADAAQKVTS